MNADANLQLAAQLACHDIYDPVAQGAFDKVYRVGETTCGVKLVGSRLHIVMQGTENLPGWLADADILPSHHPVLGRLHTGFWQNLPALMVLLKPYIVQLILDLGGSVLEIEVEGHSKGAGEAVQLAGAMHAAGYNVVQCYLFACPNAGFSDFAAYMQANIPGLSLRNADSFDIGDPVPMVPLPPYSPAYPRTRFTLAPPGWDRVRLQDWHDGKLYFAYVQAGA